MNIRRFKPSDTAQIAQLFHDTVRIINAKDYSLEQLIAWSPDDIYFRNWLEKCSSRFTYVAEVHTAAVESKIVGFGELESNGHIDCFYCHHQHQRQGVGSAIYQAIEFKVVELGLTRLFTEASITAKPFFASKKFVTIQEQKVSCRGEVLINYQMEKKLVNY